MTGDYCLERCHDELDGDESGAAEMQSSFGAPMMVRYQLSFFTAILIACVVGVLPVQANRGKGGLSGLVERHCAACHRTTLDGGIGGSLVDGQWRHGGRDADLARTIRDGLPELGMKGFRDTLSDAEIRALVVFIREQEDAHLSGEPAEPRLGQTVRTREHAFTVEPVVTQGLKVPWALDWLPDGTMLVTERPGRLRRVANGHLQAPIIGLPAVFARGQGGLMDVAIHPKYERNGWIYLSYSEPSGTRFGRRAMTAVVRGRLRDNRWTEHQVIFRADSSAYTRVAFHFGSRIVIDARNYLYFSVGDRGEREQAQELATPNGAIHRIHDDGRVPVDNPFVGRSGALSTIWSYGHRNPQGLARHPGTGEVWATEHGPRGGDELNRIQRGRNYGWPVITYGINYDGTPITNETQRDGMEQPVHHWTPSIAVCGIEFYDGNQFPAWRHDLLVASLAREELRRVRLRDGRVLEEEVLIQKMGRVRDVSVGPDGAIYIALNGPDRIVRLVRARQ